MSARTLSELVESLLWRSRRWGSGGAWVSSETLEEFATALRERDEARRGFVDRYLRPEDHADTLEHRVACIIDGALQEADQGNRYIAEPVRAIMAEIGGLVAAIATPASAAGGGAEDIRSGAPGHVARLSWQDVLNLRELAETNAVEGPWLRRLADRIAATFPESQEVEK